MSEELEKLIKTTMAEIEKLVGAKSVVGEPITIEGMTIIPLLNVGFGFGAGSGTGKGEAKQMGEGTGSGVGGGAGARPIAVIIITKDGVRVESIKGGLASAFEKIGETLPQMMEKCMERWEEKKKRKDKTFCGLSSY